ncbi:MerR family transcriptional regulator [Nesterenkonia ebinurensis]|uniref:MerR family transcriptional regulator n=1 Tax=Nesterenkonia ebinurensis TaxID=2608252 RepID=UPI001CC6B6C9|nr:MerR family transcriptional regulator [Nesterenkonia ebinurensis]
MKPADLAASAGVSTQQVRNLEAAGVLPAAERTATGYRIYTDEHLSALHCYQALARGHGAPTARTIMTSVVRGSVAKALALIDASHQALHEQRQRLAQTVQALNAINTALDEPLYRRVPMSIGELAHLLGVRTSALRVWENAGLLAPERLPYRRHRSYDVEDVRDARVIRLLRQGHYRFTRIRPIIEELRRTGSGDGLRAALGERQMAFTARARAMLHGAALLDQHLTDHPHSPTADTLAAHATRA